MVLRLKAVVISSCGPALGKSEEPNDFRFIMMAARLLDQACEYR